jgi:glycosyltransferase involved in cell wall biosynthesis
MKKKLVVYVPTYNRLEKLRYCLDAIAKEIVGYEDQVGVYVSNNCSTDGTRAYLESLDHAWLELHHNERNLGAYGNIAYAFRLPVDAEFIWTIGDDDYLMPGAIAGLVELIDAYPQADVIFCNTQAFPGEQAAAILDQYFATGGIEGGAVKSRKYVGTALIYFEQLIDSNIADTLLGELMCICFRKSSAHLLDELPDGDHENIDFTQIDLVTAGRLYQPHNCAMLESFNAKTIAVYCDAVRTFNFWGSAEWIGDYDYVFPIIILFLISEYRKRRFISEEKFKDLMTYYYSIMRASLTRQASGTSSARPFSPAIKAEMFDFLVLHTSG